MTLLEPLVILNHLDSLQDNLDAGAVCSVRVREVARSVDLVRLHLTQQLRYDVDILLGERTLADAAGLVERKVEEVCVGVRVETERTHRCACLCTTQSSPDVEQLAWLRLARLLALDNLDFTTNFTASLTCVSNVGPGYTDLVGPYGSFDIFSNFSKFILSFVMIIGRLEFFPILVLFSPKTWKKRI